MNKLLKPNDIKKQLIQRIKQHQQDKSNEIKSKKETNDDVVKFENEYQESLSYLEQIKKEKRKKKHLKQTMKKNKIKGNYSGNSSVNFSTNLEQNQSNGLNANFPKEPVYGILKEEKNPFIRHIVKL